MREELVIRKGLPAARPTKATQRGPGFSELPGPRNSGFRRGEVLKTATLAAQGTKQGPKPGSFETLLQLPVLLGLLGTRLLTLRSNEGQSKISSCCVSTVSSPESSTPNAALVSSDSVACRLMISQIVGISGFAFGSIFSSDTHRHVSWNNRPVAGRSLGSFRAQAGFRFWIFLSKPCLRIQGSMEGTEGPG